MTNFGLIFRGEKNSLWKNFTFRRCLFCDKKKFTSAAKHFPGNSAGDHVWGIVKEPFQRFQVSSNDTGIFSKKCWNHLVGIYQGTQTTNSWHVSILTSGSPKKNLSKKWGKSLDENLHFWANNLAILCDLFGMVKWPFKWLSDLQIGDEKVTLNHLEKIYFRMASFRSK